MFGLAVPLPIYLIRMRKSNPPSLKMTKKNSRPLGIQFYFKTLVASFDFDAFRLFFISILLLNRLFGGECYSEDMLIELLSELSKNMYAFIRNHSNSIIFQWNLFDFSSIAFKLNAPGERRRWLKRNRIKRNLRRKWHRSLRMIAWRSLIRVLKVSKQDVYGPSVRSIIHEILDL